MDEEATGLPPRLATNRNARVAHIRKFVCNPPARGHVLRLLEVADPPTTLGEWPRVACVDNGSTAEDVDTLLREHASTMGTEVRASLVWQDEAGLVVVTKHLRCRPQATDVLDHDMANTAEAQALGITGTQQGFLLQQQRALEASARLYMQGHQQQLVMASSQARDARELAALLGSLLKDSWAASHAAHAELDRVRATQRRELDQAAATVRELTNADADAEESGARAELIRMVGGALQQALPFIVQQVGKMLEQPPAAANAPPAEPASTAAE